MKRWFPLSPAQEPVWLAELVHPPGPANHLGTEFELVGRVDVSALEHAIQRIVRRHDPLRTTFDPSAAEAPQCVHAKALASIDHHDLSGMTEEQARAGWRQITNRAYGQHFSVREGPLVRFVLASYGDDRHTLAAVAHHLVFDGRSKHVLLHDLIGHYAATVDGAPEPPRRPPPYDEYVAEASRRARERSERTTRYLRAFPTSLSALDLPYDSERPPEWSGLAASVPIALPADVRARVAAVASDRGVSLFEVMLGDLVAVLSPYCSGDAVSIAVPMDTRTTGFRDSIGMFVNNVAVLTDVSGNPSAGDLVERVHAGARLASDARHLPLGYVPIGVGPKRQSVNPLFQVAMSFRTDVVPAPVVAGLTVHEDPFVSCGGTPCDLMLHVLDRGDELRVRLDFATDLFRPATAIAMADRYRDALAALVARPAVKQHRRNPTRHGRDMTTVAPKARPELEGSASSASASAVGEVSYERCAPGLDLALADIWAEVIGYADAGVDTDFFASGGHSLLATWAIARIREQLGVHVSVATFYAAPTPRRLAAVIAAGQGPDVRPPERPAFSLPATGAVRPRLADDPIECSYQQEGQWVVDQVVNPGTALANISLAYRVRGVLDLHRLSAALAEIVRRHEALRTTFSAIKGRPVPVLVAEPVVDVRLTDLSHVPVHERESAGERFATTEVSNPIDVGAAPLIRAAVARLDEDLHILTLTVHHIACDGWSIAVLLEELSALYAGSTVPDVGLQYSDFARWQRSHAGQTLRRWQETGSIPEAHLYSAPPSISMPTDGQWQPEPRLVVAALEFALDGTVGSRLRRLAAQSSVDLSTVLLAAYGAVLSSQARQDRLIVTTLVAGRPSQELDRVVGNFADMLPLVIDCGGDPSFTELVTRVQVAVLLAYTQQELPPEHRNRTYPRDFDHTSVVTFQLAPAWADPDNLELSGLDVCRLRPPNRAGFPCLELNIRDRGDRLSGRLGYRRDQFHHKTANCLVHRYVSLLRAVTALPRWKLSRLLPADSARSEESTFRSDGCVDFRGLKLPIHRIESLIRSHCAVSDVLVTVEGSGADENLLAFVETAETTAAELREWLSLRLPAYAIPDIVVVDTPLRTLDGYIDEEALRDEVAASRREERRRRASTEEMLASAWVEAGCGRRPEPTDNLITFGWVVLSQAVFVAAQRGAPITALDVVLHPVLAQLADVVSCRAAVVGASEADTRVEGAPSDGPETSSGVV